MKVVNFESLRVHFGKRLKNCVVNGMSILSLAMLIPAGLSLGGDFEAGELEAGQGEAGGDAGFGADAGLGGGFGADSIGAAGADAASDAGAFGADSFASGAEFPPDEALPEAVPVALTPPLVVMSAQAKPMAAVLEAYFDDIENALLQGELAELRKVCQSKQGGGCGAAKNFLSACTLFLREEDAFGESVCINKGGQSYKMNPEGFVYPANPQKNKAEQSAMDHLIGQMKESRKKLTPDKAKFLKIVCTSDALSMLENKDDKRDMQEACLEFKYHGNPPPDVLAVKVKRTPRPTIFADKESPEADEAPVKSKKSETRKKVKANNKVKQKEQQKEEIAEVVAEAEAEKADNAAAGAEAGVEAGAAAGAAAGAVAGAAAGAVAGAEVEPVQVVEVLPGQVIGAPQGNQADYGKALQAGQGLMGQYDTSGAGQQAMQGFESFSSGLKGGAGGGGLGGFAGGAGLGGGEESSDYQ